MYNEQLINDRFFQQLNHEGEVFCFVEANLYEIQSALERNDNLVLERVTDDLFLGNVNECPKMPMLVRFASISCRNMTIIAYTGSSRYVDRQLARDWLRKNFGSKEFFMSSDIHTLENYSWQYRPYD